MHSRHDCLLVVFWRFFQILKKITNDLHFQSLDPPQYVLWYHNGKIINYERVSRVSVQTDPGECKKIDHQELMADKTLCLQDPKPTVVSLSAMLSRKTLEITLVQLQIRIPRRLMSLSPQVLDWKGAFSLSIEGEASITMIWSLARTQTSSPFVGVA